MSSHSFENELCNLVRIPSISSGGKNQEDIRAIITHMHRYVTGLGFDAESFQTAGNPILVANLETDPARPWIIIYNHLDVQPANEPQWVTKPFEPVVKNGHVIGRGSTDDKGPALATLCAVDFLRRNGIEMPNIQIVYEAEEEIGSVNFGKFLDQAAGWLRTPASVLVSDTIFEGEHPAITYKLRGLVRVTATLRIGEGDRHSGLYGGAIENPLNTLIAAVSPLCGRDGWKKIPGLEEAITNLSYVEKEHTHIAASGFDIDGFLRESGHKKLVRNDSSEVLYRLWHAPTFEVHGFEGVQYEPGVIKTAIPASATARK